MAYLMAGYPDPKTSLACVRAAADAGADLIELGVPYGDPLADGKVIREAGRAALARGFGLPEALKLAERLTSGTVTRPGQDAERFPPLALMTYYNPVLQYGLERAAADARAAGVSGFIIPDLPPDAAADWLACSEGLDTVFLVAPTSTDERIRKVVSLSSGFVYAVSSLGVTGERTAFSDALPGLVERTKAVTDLPVAVGFGVADARKAAESARLADGVVVGSAIVRRQGGPHPVEEVGAFVSELARAVHSAG